MTIVLGFVLYYVANQQTPEIRYLTKSTEGGQKITINLMDGSTIRLNSKSSITYPEEFTDEQRVVVLKGQAFFDVVKDEARPFIVDAHDIRTTVLGTSFDINAYHASAVEVALVTGKVNVKLNTGSTELDANTEVILSPGQGARYDQESMAFTTGPFDAMRRVAWKDGIIYFSEATQKQVFQDLTDWYGVVFQFENKITEEWNYSGQFKNMSLEVVLNTIGYSKGFEFQILEDQVKIKFNN